MNRFAVLIAASAAATLMAFSASASAAVMPYQVLEPDVLAFDAPAAISQADCTFPMGVMVEARFVPATSDCHPALSEATGICLALDPTGLRLTKPFTPPGIVMKCDYGTRPAPPG